MKFWQMVTWAETEQYRDIARSAEELGFHGVMNADHAFYPQQLTSPYPYSVDGKPPMGGDSEYPDPWVSIAQMAAVTSTLCFSTSVYILPLRNPIEVAKATASLALMSGNRFMLGAGIGWMQEEYDTYGIDFRRRGARYDECLDALALLWRGDWCEYHGEHVNFNALRILPVPEQRIPVYLGAGIDEKGPQRFGHVPVEVRVVQHGTVIIQSNDIAVRQLGVCVAHGLAVGSVNVELGHPLAERGFSCNVACGGTVSRKPHNCEFVFCFGPSREVQNVDGRCWIDALDAKCR